MGMYINSATSGLLLTRSLYQASAMQTNIMKRLSSGIRINSASDDAAGLSLSQKLTSVINGNTVAKNNAQTGIAMLNTADGALSVMTNSLERIRNLAVQAANGVYSNSERQMLQKEVSQLSDDIQQTYQSTNFSNKNVFGAQSTTTTKTAQLSEAQAIAAGYNDAHIIRTASDFKNKITADLSGSFILTNDIDLSGLGTLSTSVINANFSGNLDGNGHSANNLSISSAAAVNNFALIKTSSGNIKNLTISNASINTANSDFSGILVGSATAGSITNCSSSGTITAKGYTGGLIGIIAIGVTVDNCSSSANVNSSTAITGGLVGQSSGTITNSSTSGVVSATGNNAGGIVGMNFGTINDSSSSATVSGDTNIGGLVGYNSGANVYINNCSASGKVTAAFWTAGGLVGIGTGIISGCYATGNVTAGGGQAGGFMGIVGATAVINNCYSTGNATGPSQSGGFAGHISGAVTNSYATGMVTASSNFGGFTGTISGTAASSCFYKNNIASDLSSAVNGNTTTLPTNTWDSSVWDTSGTLPALKNVKRAYGVATTLLGLQIGDDANSASKIDINTAFGMGDLNFIVSNKDSAGDSINQADKLMNFLNSMRSNVGASVNKLSSVITIQDNRINNLSASKSSINDTDMAKESAQMIKTQIHSQAATSLLSQVKGLDANLLRQLIS